MSEPIGQLMLLTPTIVALVIWLVVVPLGLRGIFEAFGTERSRAWIPFVNLATVYRLGGFSEFWLIALVIPVANIVGAIVLFVASHRINRRLCRSGWYTVLAVLVWWLWTLALGLQRRVDRSSVAEPEIWSTQHRPATSIALPGGDDSSTPSPRGAVEHAAGRVAAYIPPMPDAEFFASIGVRKTDASAQPAPLIAPPADPVAAHPIEDLPAGIDDPADPADTDDDATILTNRGADATILTNRSADETIVSPRRRPRWWVQTTMGARIELTGASAILGRRPAPHPLYPGAQLIAVTDDALSVSATHAVLEFVGGDWQVTDLDSTNGVWLVDSETGAESELGARNRARVTDKFMLGELGVQVVQGG